MKLVVTIEVEEREWKKAIAEGWNEYFEENLTVADIKNVDAPGDFQRALPRIDESCIKSVAVS